MQSIFISYQWLLLLAAVACAQGFIELSAEYLSAIQAEVKADEAAGSFNYDQNGDDWTGLCATGLRQSPIDLISDYSIVKPLPRIHFHYYNQSLKTPLVIMNNGHSANLIIPKTRGGQRPYINGGMLPGDFEVQSVHFHWGSNFTQGSEHAINYYRYSVEMHIVHKNVKYDTLDSALENADGLAVLGVMFIASESSPQQPGLNKIFNQLPRIVEYNSNATITGQLNLDQLLGRIVTGQFYTYNGSLTTPGCEEVVTWTVFTDAVNVPIRQVMKFFKLKDSRGRPLINNYRSIQDTNGRPVYLRTFQ